MKLIAPYLTAALCAVTLALSTATQAGEYTSSIRTTDVLELYTVSVDARERNKHELSEYGMQGVQAAEQRGGAAEDKTSCKASCGETLHCFCKGWCADADHA